MDCIDKVIWILPVLAVFDVVSTFYVGSLGYPLSYYEQGLFASLAIGAGLVYGYLYAIIYLLMITSIAALMWYLKNKKLNPTGLADKVTFLILVAAACYIYVRLTVAFVTNFFLPSIIERGINLYWLTVIVGLSSLLSLNLYVWRDVLAWIKADGEKNA